MKFRQWYLGIPVAAAALFPLSANATIDLVDGATTIKLKFQGVTIENPDTVGVNPDGGAAIDGGSCNADLSKCVETTWGVGTLTQSIDNFTSLSVWNTGDGGRVLAYVIYGIADISITGDPPSVEIANTGATSTVAGLFGVGDGTINIDIYDIPVASAPCFQVGCANLVDPLDRSANTGGTANVSGITNVVGGTLFAHIELVPEISSDPNETLHQTVTGATLPADGSGTFYADCVSGPGCDQFAAGDWGPTIADFFGGFHLTDNTTQACSPFATDGCKENQAGWPGHVEDPIFALAAVPVPEPASLALLGSALACLGVAVRRRRKGLSA